jgi:hypothetical protein
MATIQPKLIRIREVLNVEPFQITCRWSNGEIRINDLSQKIAYWQKSRYSELALLAEPEKFKTAFAQNGTIAFAGILIDTSDTGLQPLDLDPDVLFTESSLVARSPKEPVH